MLWFTNGLFVRIMAVMLLRLIRPNMNVSLEQLEEDISTVQRVYVLLRNVVHHC